MNERISEGITVLIVDDNLWVDRKYIEMDFNHVGLKLAHAERLDELSEEAVKAADVLVMDARMSEDQYKFTGIDTVVQMIASGTVRPNVPIVFTSVHGEDKAKAKLSRIRDSRRFVWIQRPFTTSFLIITIREELISYNC